MRDPKPFPGLKWPPGEPQPSRRSFAFGDDGLITSFDDYSAAVEAKKRAQARERERLGLPPADFVDFGLQGEPRKPE